MSVQVHDLAPTVPVPSAPRRLDARERIELLCDPGSIHVIRSAVRSRRIGARAEAGDGVIAAAATIDGRAVCCYAQDARFVGGSLGEAQADTIVRVLEFASEARLPVIAFIESAGARIQEATAALGGYGRIFRATVRLSGIAPQISVISGMSAGGGSYAPALTDFLVMSREAKMFLTGPGVVRDALGEQTTAEALGGSRVHARNGVSDFVVDDDVAAQGLVRRILSYLPQNHRERAPEFEPRDPEPGNPGAIVPRETRQVYDVRTVIRRIVDRDSLLEIAPRWARNVITAFARLNGKSVGVIANQPRYLGGVLDAESADKAARFVRTCDRFGVPIVVFVDTPGFLPGSRQEHQGVIRRGAGLLHAFASAEVPRVTVVLRQAYGGAYITMNAKDLGADFAFAWPRARIGIMAAPQAIRITCRREVSAANDPERCLQVLSERYAAEHQNAQAAAREGFIDEVILPAETRDRLIGTLAALSNKRRWDQGAWA
jgi:acetyl-CoA carboxylase carboxyltransferase component